MLFYKIMILKRAEMLRKKIIGATSETCSHIIILTLNTTLLPRLAISNPLASEIYETCKQTKFNPQISSKLKLIT